jgi:hypothetical protein
LGFILAGFENLLLFLLIFFRFLGILFNWICFLNILIEFILKGLDFLFYFFLKKWSYFQKVFYQNFKEY